MKKNYEYLIAIVKNQGHKMKLKISPKLVKGNDIPICMSVLIR